MSLIPSLSNPYLAAFVGGISYGMVVCTAACVPYLASYIAGVGAGFRKGIGITMIFNSGRITGYALLGALVGVFSGLFKLLDSGTAISPLQTYSSLIFGILTMAIGVFVLVKYRSATCDCKPSPTNRFIAIGKKGQFGFDLGAFSLGLSRGLILCPPLVPSSALRYTLFQPGWKRGFSRIVWIRYNSVTYAVFGRSHRLAFDKGTFV